MAVGKVTMTSAEFLASRMPTQPLTPLGMSLESLRNLAVELGHWRLQCPATHTDAVLADVLAAIDRCEPTVRADNRARRLGQGQYSVSAVAL